MKTKRDIRKMGSACLEGRGKGGEVELEEGWLAAGQYESVFALWELLQLQVESGIKQIFKCSSRIPLRAQNWTDLSDTAVCCYQTSLETVVE